MSDRPPELIPVPSAKIISLFTEAIHGKSSVLFWVCDQKQTFKSELMVVLSKNPSFKILKPKNFSPPPKPFSCYFNLTSKRASLFFKCHFLNSNEIELEFEIPEKVFKIQRRKEPRFTVPFGHTLKVEFADPFFSESSIQRKVHDIGIGGLSFCVQPGEDALYPSGLHIYEMKLTLRGKTLVVDAEVRHDSVVNEGPRKGEIKIGVVFTKIKPSDSELLAAYVQEEIQLFYSRFL